MQKIYFSIMRQSLCFFVTMGMLLAAPAAKAVDSDQTQVITGHVIQVDPVGRTLVVAYLERTSSALINITFSVPGDTIIVGGEEHLQLDDVQVSDRVEIEFSGDPVGNPVAKRIVDMDRTNASD